MSYLQMPVRSDIPSFDFQIQLEGVTYGLEFRWNERGQFWSFDVLTASGVEIVTGMKIVGGYPLMLKHRQPTLPPGEFYAIDTQGENKTPGVDDFGSRILFLYRESTTDDDAILAGTA